jgi:hypothetical protein
MKVSTGRTKVMAFKGKEHIRSRICVYDKPTEQVSSFKYLGFNISYEKDIDISTKILNYNSHGNHQSDIQTLFSPETHTN